MDFKYDVLRTMDGVCTASMMFPGRMIRLWTARLKGYKGFKEFTRLFVANHFGYIIRMGEKYWIAEMLGGGLKVNSLREYLRNPEREKIVSIVRHPLFDNEQIREEANSFVIQKCAELVDYDYKGSPGAFLGLCGDGPEEWYCSEMGENVVNMFGATWDNWQLSRKGKKARIAPIEIQFGKRAKQVRDFIDYSPAP